MYKTISKVLLTALFALLIVQCEKVRQPQKPAPEPEPSEQEPEVEEEEEKYTSHWYYSYAADKVLDAAGLSLESFNPFTLTHRNDTLFVVNYADTSVVLIDLKTNSVLNKIHKWSYNGTPQRFISIVEAMTVDRDRLYIAERSSYVHVFSLPGLDYITRFGNGSSLGQVSNPQAIVVKDSLIFCRDKNGRISTYKVSDVTPEKYGKVNRYRHSAAHGGVNNSFGPHTMVINKEGKIWLTDYTGSKLFLLDPSLVNDDMQNNTPIAIEDSTMTLTFKPTSLTLADGRMYSTDNSSIHIYDKANGGWISPLKSIKGYTFVQPDRVYAQNDSVLWVSDMGTAKKLVKMIVHKSEVRVYE